MADISNTTGEQYYSGDWGDIQDVLRVIEIGEGVMSRINQPMVNRYQEMIDRDIDAILIETYHTPIRATNQYMLTGSQGMATSLRVFPGDVRRAARYWTAGQLLLNEFQQLDSNLTEQVTSMVNDARLQVHGFTSPTHRIPGQRRKSNISRTMPPNMQPSALPERPV